MLTKLLQIYYHISMTTLDQSWLRVLAGLFVNLSAFWYGAAYAIIHLLNEPHGLLRLTVNLALGTLCLIAAVKFDRKTL